MCRVYVGDELPKREILNEDQNQNVPFSKVHHHPQHLDPILIVPRVFAALGSNIDIAPTFIDIAGLPPNPEHVPWTMLCSCSDMLCT